MDNRKRRITFYRKRTFWVILIIVAIILWALSTVISGRRAKTTNNLNSMPAIEQQVTQQEYTFNINPELAQ